MNKVLLSLGSNLDSKNNIQICCKLLDSYFENIVYSQICETAPYGKNYKLNFLNQLATFQTAKELLEVQSILKLIEKTVGREPDDKITGLVKIDVDLVVWNDLILKPKDFDRSYVKSLIHTLPQDIFDDILIPKS